ncbi:unnamed protein product, partial [Rotaria magnacalcarata]
MNLMQTIDRIIYRDKPTSQIQCTQYQSVQT